MTRHDAWSAVVEVAATQHGVFTRTQAAERGISRRRLSAMRDNHLIDEVQQGVFVFAGSAGGYASLQAAVLASGGVISHRAAAHLHRLRGFDRLVAAEVLVATAWVPRLEHAIVHRWPGFPRRHVTMVDGLPCTSVAATLLQLGAVVDDDAVEHALDDALQRGFRERWITETLTELRRPGPNGSGALDRVLQRPWRSAELPESWLERLLTRLVHDLGLPAPRLQYPVVVGDRRFRLDLAYPDIKLGLAGHSRQYHFGKAKEAADHERDLLLAAAGWEVIYLTYWQVARPESLAERLRQCFDARRVQIGPMS